MSGSEKLSLPPSLSLSLCVSPRSFVSNLGLALLARQAKHSDSRLGRLAHSSLCLLCREALQTE